MKLVLDANVAAYWVLHSSLTAKAIRLRDEYRRQVHELIAPSIFTAEAASALTKAERQRLIPVGQARIRLADILTTPPAMHPYEPLIDRAVDISSQTRSSLLDCLNVALAQREGCELVTADQRLINNLGTQLSFIRHLSSLP